MDDRRSSFEQDKAQRALREMVQNLLRCLSGGQAGKWYSLMPDIYSAALADQEYRANTGRVLSEEAIRGALEWKMDYWKERESTTNEHRLELDEEKHLEDAYSCALRLIAYRISKTPKALHYRAAREFLASLEQREQVRKEIRAKHR